MQRGEDGAVHGRVWKAEVNKAVSLWIKKDRYRHDITPESVSYIVWRTDGGEWKV